MKVVTWNVKKYLLWETLLSNEWDILCAVEHKCHELAGSRVDLRGWQGSVLKKGSLFRQLGYPLRMNVTNAQLIEWMSSKLRDKYPWKSQS